jgi:hypothetical protein
MTAHSVRDNEQPSTRLTPPLFLRAGQRAEILVFRAHFANVGAQRCPDNKTAIKNGIRRLI